MRCLRTLTDGGNKYTKIEIFFSNNFLPGTFSLFFFFIICLDFLAMPDACRISLVMYRTHATAVTMPGPYPAEPPENSTLLGILIQCEDSFADL